MYIVKKHTLPNSVLDQVILNYSYVSEYPNRTCYSLRFGQNKKIVLNSYIFLPLCFDSRPLVSFVRGATEGFGAGSFDYSEGILGSIVLFICSFVFLNLSTYSLIWLLASSHYLGLVLLLHSVSVES